MCKWYLHINNLMLLRMVNKKYCKILAVRRQHDNPSKNLEIASDKFLCIGNTCVTIHWRYQYYGSQLLYMWKKINGQLYEVNHSSISLNEPFRWFFSDYFSLMSGLKKPDKHIKIPYYLDTIS